MTPRPTILFSSFAFMAPLVLGAGLASATPCPPPGPPAACGGRQIGDLLIVSRGAPFHVAGLNPASRTYYDFTASAAIAGAGDGGQILAEPSNPTQTLVIGDTSANGQIAIREFDACGASTNTLWGTFSNLPPGATLATTLNRSLAAEPITGLIVSPGGFGDLVMFPPAGGVDVWAPLSPAVDASHNDVAFDEAGDLFAKRASDGAILRFPAATVSQPPVTGTAIPGTAGVINDMLGMVADGHGSLFAVGNDAILASGEVWKIDLATQQTSLFTPDMGPLFGFAPMPIATAITMDGSGTLWVTLLDFTSGSFAGVVAIDGVSGQVQDFFPTSAGSPPTPVNGPQSIAVYGVNLPAVQAVCQNRAPCSVGGIAVGACLGSGLVDPASGQCIPPAGVPSNDWHTEPSPNGSWDWNCDGITAHEYVNLNTSFSGNHVCGGTATTCPGTQHLFTDANPVCGAEFGESTFDCVWIPPSPRPRVGQGCVTPNPSTDTELFQGCK